MFSDGAMRLPPARAAELAPDSPRFALVYAIGLNDTGRSDDARAVLRDARARHPNDPGVARFLAQLEGQQQPGS